MKEQQRRPSPTTIIKAMQEEVIGGSKASAIHSCWYSRRFGQSAQGPASRPTSRGGQFARKTRSMRRVFPLNLIGVIAAAVTFLGAPQLIAAPSAPSAVPPVSDAASYVAGANTVKAHDL